MSERQRANIESLVGTTSYRALPQEGGPMSRPTPLSPDLTDRAARLGL